MKRVNLIYILNLFIVITCFSCNKEEEEGIDYTNFNIEKTILDVNYGRDSKQTFDIYLPANRSEKSTKTLILIHGGAWIEGDKIDMNAIVNVLRKELPNYAIVNMNYRLASVDNPAFPMQINDVNYVISFLKKSNYGISDEFGLIGASAGGHLAMLYSYAIKDKAIKMVCSLIGPTNFADENYTKDGQFSTLLRIVTGVPFEKNENYYKHLSPLHQVTEQAPPTIMFYGNQDPLVPNTQSYDLYNKLRNLSIYKELYVYDSGHGDWSASDQIDINKKLVNFIEKKF